MHTCTKALKVEGLEASVSCAYTLKHNLDFCVGFTSQVGNFVDLDGPRDPANVAWTLRSNIVCLYSVSDLHSFVDRKATIIMAWQGYKYGHFDAPFAAEVARVLEKPRVAVFSEQGAAVGKRKGRKPKDAINSGKGEKGDNAKQKRGVEAPGDGEANGSKRRKRRAKALAPEPLSDEKGEAAEIAPPRPESSKSRAKRGQGEQAKGSDGVVAAPKPKPKAARQAPAATSSAVEDPAVPALEDLESPYAPPDHVQAGHVYSNAYRKYLSGDGNAHDKDGAKLAARMASAIFRAYGVVVPAYCGEFASKPRKGVEAK